MVGYVSKFISMPGLSISQGIVFFLYSYFSDKTVQLVSLSDLLGA